MLVATTKAYVILLQFTRLLIIAAVGLFVGHLLGLLKVVTRLLTCWQLVGKGLLIISADIK